MESPIQFCKSVTSNSLMNLFKNDSVILLSYQHFIDVSLMYYSIDVLMFPPYSVFVVNRK